MSTLKPGRAAELATAPPALAYGTHRSGRPSV